MRARELSCGEGLRYREEGAEKRAFLQGDSDCRSIGAECLEVYPLLERGPTLGGQQPKIDRPETVWAAYLPRLRGEAPSC